MTVATTRLSFTSTYAASETSAVIFTASPGSTRSLRRADVDLIGHAVHEPAHEPAPERGVRRVVDRHLGVHAPEPRILNRHGDRLAAAVALIREHDLILPGLSVPESSTVAPGFTARIGLTAVTSGISFQLRRCGFGFGNLRDGRALAGLGRPRREDPVARCDLRPLSFSMTTGSTSPTGVPAQPPSANDRRPPSISRPPPRLFTKSAIMRSCSGVNDAASTLPRIRARYWNSSSRVFGKPPISSSALVTDCGGSTCSRRSAAASTTWRFLSSSTARRMNFASERGSPS